MVIVSCCHIYVYFCVFLLNLHEYFKCVKKWYTTIGLCSSNGMLWPKISIYIQVEPIYFMKNEPIGVNNVPSYIFN